MSRIVMDFGAVDDTVVEFGVEGEGGWVSVITDGRECAMREEGLRGYSVLKGPKPVISTLISSGDCVSEPVLGGSWRGG